MTAAAIEAALEAIEMVIAGSHGHMHNILPDDALLVRVGEAGFNAAIASHFGVPVALCGNDTLDAKIKALMLWRQRVVIKLGDQPYSGAQPLPRWRRSRFAPEQSRRWPVSRG